MKIYTQNLGMIVTEKCNLNCGHCLRGCSSEKMMSDEVIENTLDQIAAIGNLAICGGEPTFALSRLEKIFSYIIENKIFVDQVTMVINGTVYSEELLRLLDYIDEYIKINPSDNNFTIFKISWDQFHFKEVDRLNIKEKYFENISKYSESKYFDGLQRLSGKLFREGNAEELDTDLTVPLRPMKTIMTYVGKNNKFDRENGLCNIGPLVTVNVNGTITECDASIEHQESLYNYGNVLTDSIEDICLRGDSYIIKPSKWKRETGKVMKKFNTYQK